MIDYTDTIGRGLAQRLPGFDWSRSESVLRKPTRSGWIGIAIEAMPTSSPDVFKLASHGQIRIDDIERAYSPFDARLTKETAQSHATLVVNCDTLLRESPLIHGFRADPASIACFICDYAKELEDIVIPWLERHSTENSLFEGLSSKNPRQWITSDRLVRFPVLLAILSRRRDWVQYESVAGDFMAFCDKPYAQVHRAHAKAIIEGLRG
jgi:hypothetical protein